MGILWCRGKSSAFDYLHITRAHGGLEMNRNFEMIAASELMHIAWKLNLGTIELIEKIK